MDIQPYYITDAGTWEPATGERWWDIGEHRLGAIAGAIVLPEGMQLEEVYFAWCNDVPGQLCVRLFVRAGKTLLRRSGTLYWLDLRLTGEFLREEEPAKIGKFVSEFVVRRVRKMATKATT